MIEIRFEQLPFLAQRKISTGIFNTNDHAYFSDGKTYFIAYKKDMKQLIIWNDSKKDWR